MGSGDLVRYHEVVALEAHTSHSYRVCHSGMGVDGVVLGDDMQNFGAGSHRHRVHVFTQAINVGLCDFRLVGLCECNDPTMRLAPDVLAGNAHMHDVEFAAALALCIADCLANSFNGFLDVVNRTSADPFVVSSANGVHVDSSGGILPPYDCTNLGRTDI